MHNLLAQSFVPIKSTCALQGEVLDLMNLKIPIMQLVLYFV